MYAPEGYLTCWQVYSRLADAISDQVSVTEGLLPPKAQCQPREGNEEHKPAAPWPSLRRNLTAKEIFPLWAVWRMLRSADFAAYICSPEGVTLTASHIFFQGEEVLNFEDYIIPVPDEGPLSDLVDQIIEKERANEFAYEFARDGHFVDPDTWTIRERIEVIEGLEETRRFRSERYARRIAKQENCFDKLTDDIDDWHPDDQDFEETVYFRTMMDKVLRFSGWAICFKADQIPESQQALLDLVGLELAIDKNKGHGTLSPAEIVNEIVRLYDDGFPTVRDKVRRQLAPNMKIDQWRAVWAQAAGKRPKLSKRGPKTRRRNL